MSTPDRAFATCDGPVDVVVDPVFGVAADGGVAAPAQGGRLVNLGGAGGDQATFSSAALRSRSASVLGYTNNALTLEQRAEAITTVFGHVVTGRIRMTYDVHSAAEAERVWSAIAAGDAQTRCVLDLT